MTPGKFLTLEGIDGAGKSSHLEFIADWARRHGHSLLVTREPGGTGLGEALRELLLHRDMRAETEALLMFAARNEHVARVIQPALADGIWVLSDRYLDASYAYQCGGRGLAPERIAALEAWLDPRLLPDCTFLFDIKAIEAARRRSAVRSADRFEREAVEFFGRVRRVYLDRAAAEPQRFRVLDSAKPIDVLQTELAVHLDALA